jgi:hypothetical protein
MKNSTPPIYIAAVMFAVLFVANVSLGQEWRGIKILESTREDVKSALGVDKCEYPRSVFRNRDGCKKVKSFKAK